MKSVLPFAFVLCSGVITPAAVAQDAGNSAISFEALPLVLTVGQEVKVRDEAGATRGKLVSLSDNQLVVARRQFWFPYLRPRVERVFVKDSIRTVDAVDSSWNGALIGAVAGGLLGARVAAAWNANHPDADGIAEVFYVPLLGMVGGASAVELIY